MTGRPTPTLLSSEHLSDTPQAFLSHLLLTFQSWSLFPADSSPLGSIPL